MKTDPETFILEQTTLGTPPLVPEIRLHLASDAHALWQKTEDELEEIEHFKAKVRSGFANRKYGKQRARAFPGKSAKRFCQSEIRKTKS